MKIVLSGFADDEKDTISTEIREHGGKIKRKPSQITVNLLKRRTVPVDPDVQWLNAKFIRKSIAAQKLLPIESFIISKEKIERWDRKANGEALKETNTGPRAFGKSKYSDDEKQMFLAALVVHINGGGEVFPRVSLSYLKRIASRTVPRRGMLLP